MFLIRNWLINILWPFDRRVKAKWVCARTHVRFLGVLCMNACAALMGAYIARGDLDSVLAPKWALRCCCVEVNGSRWPTEVLSDKNREKANYFRNSLISFTKGWWQWVAIALAGKKELWLRMCNFNFYRHKKQLLPPIHSHSRIIRRTKPNRRLARNGGGSDEVFNNAVLLAVKAGFYLIMPYKQGVFIIKLVSGSCLWPAFGLGGVGSSVQVSEVVLCSVRRRSRPIASSFVSIATSYSHVDAYRRSTVYLFISGCNGNIGLLHAGGIWTGWFLNRSLWPEIDLLPNQWLQDFDTIRN